MRVKLAALLILVAQPANAHAMLERASPAAGAVVSAPGEIVLHYSESLEPAFSSIQVRNASGTVISDPASVSDTTMRATVKTLPPGRYKVIWHAVSVDTHSSEGSFTFTVKP